MKIKSKFWLEDDAGEAVFGEGRRKILELIDDLGSMQATAKALGMSYRGVWARIRATEERLGVKLIETSVGRGKDRGSRLTPEAKKLLHDFRDLHKRAIDNTDRLFATIIEGQTPEAERLLPALAVVGPPGSGKKALINRLISGWEKKGLRTGVIKWEEHKPEDLPPAEELDHGAQCLIRMTDEGMLIQCPGLFDFTPEAVAANYCPGSDLVLIEHDQRLHIPTVEVFRRKLAKSPLTRKRKYLVAVVGDQPEDKPNWPYVPEDNIEELMTRVEKELFTQTMGQEDVSLIVNGKRVPMLPFVKQMFENAVVGMVGALKACDTPHTLELKIRRH